MTLRYPVYIPTKGRHDSRFTIKMFERLRVPYTAVIEPQEFDLYARHVSPDKLLVLPHRDQGLVVTRNWIWEHAAARGVHRFWTFDDNIRGLHRLNRNLKIQVADATIMCAIEDFADRYQNLYIAGMNYTFFAKRKQKIPPFVLNTRVYSNMLIETAIPFRNEGFYNDDTDLCLRILKAGHCTAQFNAFLIQKAETMSVTGGMTPHYLGDGRFKMARELVDKHPDVARMSQKFGRWQHHVDYSSFKHNRLKRKAIACVDEKINEYGMQLQEIRSES